MRVRQYVSAVPTLCPAGSDVGLDVLTQRLGPTAERRPRPLLPQPPRLDLRLRPHLRRGGDSTPRTGGGGDGGVGATGAAGEEVKEGGGCWGGGGGGGGGAGGCTCLCGPDVGGLKAFVQLSLRKGQQGGRDEG